MYKNQKILKTTLVLPARSKPILIICPSFTYYLPILIYFTLVFRPSLTHPKFISPLPVPKVSLTLLVTHPGPSLSQGADT